VEIACERGKESSDTIIGGSFWGGGGGLNNVKTNVQGNYAVGM
jgi:hypothetical protein